MKLAMPEGAKRSARGGLAPVRSVLLRRIGQVVLWSVVALIGIQGIIAILGGDEGSTTTPVQAQVAPDDTRAYAVLFAQEWLSTTGSPQARSSRLGAYLPEGLDISDPARGAPATRVVSAIPAGERRLDSTTTAVTVAAVLESDGRRRVRYLSVPVSRSPEGALVVAALPAIVTPPARANLPLRVSDLPQETEADVRSAVGQFLAAWLGGGDQSQIAYYLAPGAEPVRPLAPALGEVRLTDIGAVGGSPNAGSNRLRVLAGIAADDPAARGAAQAQYVLDLVWRDRWQVSRVSSAPPSVAPVQPTP